MLWYVAQLLLEEPVTSNCLCFAFLDFKIWNAQFQYQLCDSGQDPRVVNFE